LSAKSDGPGVDCARGGFDLTPTLAKGEEDRFDGFGAWEGGPLFPLGEIYDSHYFLGIDDAGVVYIVGDTIVRLAPDIYVAIDCILSGRSSA
jgi:hypothetical protein